MPNLSDRATGLTNVNVISLNELSTSPSDPAAGQKRLYAKDDGKVYTLDSDGNEKEVGSGGGASVEVAQSGHGFIIGDVLYFDGTNYVKAKADAANTAEVVGIVSEVVDIDNFVATTAGYVESGLELDVAGDPLVAGSVYFLSADTAGGLTLNEPNVVGQVSRPVLLVSAARTAEGAADAKGFVLPYRGVVVGGSNARTSLSLNNNGSTNIQDMSDYDAGELSGWIYIKAGVADADSLRFYVEAQVSKNGAGDDYNISYQTSGDTPPSGFDMNVSSAGMVSVVLPDVSGFSSANINYSLNAAAVGVDLPLSISGENILEATSSVRGTVKKNRWQRKVLSADVSAATFDMSTTSGNSDFKFTGLTIGQHYELKLNFRQFITAGDAFLGIDVFNLTSPSSSDTRLFVIGDGNEGSSLAGPTTSGSVIFKATSSDIRIGLSSLDSGSYIVGGLDNNSSVNSSMTLIERNDLEDEVDIW
jgi:hypothetical protein